MIFEDAPDDPESKSNRMVRNVAKIYHENPGKTQMIFSDIGANPMKNGFHLFKDIVNKLVKSGIPKNEIVDFTKVKNEAQRAEWTQALREGKVRVALGGTDTLGTGVNAQNKLLALHHLDCPHRPSDLEQRDGRGWRHGNENKHVHIHRYVTEGSLDEMFWQGIARKARFIKQILSPDEQVARTAQEEDTEELSPEHVMAAAAGDPRILEKVQLGDDVRTLSNAKVRHEREQHDFERKIKAADAKADEYKRAIEDWKHSVGRLAENPDFAMEIDGNHYDKRTEADEALKKWAETAPTWGSRIIGHYRGMPLKFNTGRVYLQTHGGRSVFAEPSVQSIEHRARGLDNHLRAAEGDLERHEKDVAQIRSKYGKAFPKEQELTAKTARLKELEKELAGDAPDYAENDAARAEDFGHIVEMLKTGRKDEAQAEYRAALKRHGVRDKDALPLRNKILADAGVSGDE
jgi:hypothetical protein